MDEWTEGGQLGAIELAQEKSVLDEARNIADGEKELDWRYILEVEAPDFKVK